MQLAHDAQDKMDKKYEVSTMSKQSKKSSPRKRADRVGGVVLER
jgi:hypothetical protein